MHTLVMQTHNIYAFSGIKTLGHFFALLKGIDFRPETCAAFTPFGKNIFMPFQKAQKA